jgi:hypothetical protein
MNSVSSLSRMCTSTILSATAWTTLKSTSTLGMKQRVYEVHSKWLQVLKNLLTCSRTTQITVYSTICSGQNRLL